MKLFELYKAEQFPIFQNRMFDTEESACRCAVGDIELVQNLDTGLIYNRVFNPDVMIYDGAYQNEQAVSEVFRKHLSKVTDIIRGHFDGAKLIEIGCGKGYFLKKLREFGFDVTGIDPTYEGSDPNILKAYFTPEVGMRANGIVLRHVLEHIFDPVKFLGDIRDANGGGGLIYIEVPCFDWICGNSSWFDIFYEHVNYFRLSDFDRIFEGVLESGHVFGGQYLYVVADLSRLQSSPRMNDHDIFAFPSNFLDGLRRSVKRVCQAKESGCQEVAVWGGASKGTIFSLLLGRSGVVVDRVIDVNPAKQGRFLPATGLRVSSPEEVVDSMPADSLLLVMNPNYLDEIRDATDHRFVYETPV